MAIHDVCSQLDAKIYQKREKKTKVCFNMRMCVCLAVVQKWMAHIKASINVDFIMEFY